jgi:hypothetical protein
MSEPQRDITYILHWGDLASTVRMLAAARLLRDVHKRDRIILLTKPDFESFLKHCPYFNLIETDALPDARPMAGLRDKRIKLNKPVRVYDLVGDADSRKLKRLFRFSKCRWTEIAADPRTGEHPVDAVAGRLNAALGLAPEHFPLGAAPPPDTSWVDYLSWRASPVMRASCSARTRPSYICWWLQGLRRWRFTAMWAIRP